MTTDPVKPLTVAEKSSLAARSWIPEDYIFERLDTKESYVIANIHHALYGRFPNGYEEWKGLTPEQEKEMLKGYELQNDPQEIPGERDRF